MIKPKLAVTIRSINKENLEKIKKNFDLSYLNKTNKRLSQYEMIKAVKGADAVLAGTEPLDENVLNSTDSLEVISRVGIGLDNIDLKTASEKNILICNTPNSPTRAVAEHTTALIFALCKNIVHYNSQRNKSNNTPVTGILLSGKVIGIIGLGRIGFTVAKMLFATGCKIAFYDPYISEKNLPSEWIRYSKINKLLEKSDIITLHMPPKEDNSPIINKKSFEHIKKGTIIINTSRSSLIDENALLEAIDKEIISGAGLDVYDSIIEDQIQNYPQIILTPHVASNTKESRDEMEREAIGNIINAFKGINS